MTVTDKDKKKYLNQIKKLLCCNSMQRKMFIDSFSDNMDEYLNDNPNADFSQLQKDLGTPEEIASAFLENVPAKDIKKRTSVVKWIVATVILALVIYVAAIITSLIDAHRSHNGQGTITIETIEITTDNLEEGYITEEE